MIQRKIHTTFLFNIYIIQKSILKYIYVAHYLPENKIQTQRPEKEHSKDKYQRKKGRRGEKRIVLCECCIY